MEEDSNNNNKTIDQQQQQNIDESQEISKPLDFSGEKKEEDVQQQQQIVPVLEEDYSISKQTTIKEAKIEKRLVTKTKTVKVPTSYEELYINGKKLKSVEESQILSALKDKISSIATSGNAGTSVEQSVKKKNKIENRGELVPLFSSSSSATTAASYDYDEVKGNSETQIEKEKVIPLYEEQFEIIKKMVKVAEIVITKRRVIEKKKIDVDIRGEEVTIKYPDGRSEKLS